MELEAVVNGHKTKTGGKLGETLRFDLQLASPSEESTNEFSYARLVAKRRKKEKSKDASCDTSLSHDQSASADDPFGDESHDKLTAIAKQFEDKYGPKKKRKRMIHDSDLIDRGYGYDLADSFVDDSELYEDFIPYQLDTEHGGFYINTGNLNFKTSDDIDDVDDFVLKKRKPAIKKQPSHHAILASQKLKKAKQHVASQKTPKKLLSVPSSTGNPSMKSVSSSSKIKPPAAKRPKKQENGLKLASSKLVAGEPSAVSSNVSRPGVSTPSIPISIGNISVSVPIFDHASKSIDGALSALSQGESTATVIEKSSESPQDTVKSPPALPQGLPVEILTKISQLEEVVLRDQEATGKISNKTRSSYDERLVEIELACKAVSTKIRAAVLEYLGYKLNVSRGTLVKRVKQMLRKREDDELEEPLRKLKQAVDASMPEQIAQYEEARTSQSSITMDTVAQDTTTDKLLSEVDEDGDVFENSLLPGGSQPQGSGQETSDKPPGSQEPPSKQPAKKPPPLRKKYKWSDETKKLLCDVVQAKVASEERINRINRGNGEETINQFLEEKVKPMWPKGWMQKSVLFKMSESVHRHFTNPQLKKVAVKKEKAITVKREPIEKLVIRKDTLEKYTKTSSETISPKITIKKEAAEPKKPSTPKLTTANPTTSGGPLLLDKAQTDTLIALLNKTGTQLSSVIGKTQQPKKSSVISGTKTKGIISTAAKTVSNPPGASSGKSVITSTEKKRTFGVSSPKAASLSQKKQLPMLISPPKPKVLNQTGQQLSTATKTPTPTVTTTNQPSQVTRVITNPSSSTLLSNTTSPNTYFIVTSGGSASSLVLLPQTATQIQHTSVVSHQSLMPSLSNTATMTTKQAQVQSTLQQKSLPGSHSVATQVKTAKLQLKKKSVVKSTAVTSSAVIPSSAVVPSSSLVTPSSISGRIVPEVHKPTPAIHLPRVSLPPDLIPSVPKHHLGTTSQGTLTSCSDQIPATGYTTPTTTVYTSVLQQPSIVMTKPSSFPLEKSTTTLQSVTTNPAVIVPPLKTAFTVQSPVSVSTSIVNTGASSYRGSPKYTLASLSLSECTPGLTKLTTVSSPISGHTQSTTRELLSPLKSPVEQIFEEHSYHGSSQDIFSLPASSANNRQGSATGSSSLMDTGSEVAEMN